ASMTSVRDWDSIATLSLIVEAEEEFGITIGLDSADVVESFDDLCGVVVRSRRISFEDIPPRHLRH
ncbi:MAG TPA: acyl carrier protein, partial [Acidiphilium sp.]|nr:acyl carrier protein [Acidiphilium sp.]